MPGLAVTYLGGPTVVLDYAGLRFIIDPTFDEPGTYPDPDGTPLVKTRGPAIPLTELRAVDVVLLSHHEHEDNLDTLGSELVASGLLTLTTPYAAAGLALPNVRGLATWESTELAGGITVTAAPALHGPSGSDEELGPVTGFVVQAAGEPTIYVSGDNASLGLVRDIAARFDIDIAVLFAGAARVPEIPATLTLTSREAADAAQILGASRVVGVHTEDWEHFSESRADLEAAFSAAGIADLLVETPRGISVNVD
jgi:L-ascorbate metabolism protein UlaG (beta-lactamase superfamily)